MSHSSHVIRKSLTRDFNSRCSFYLHHRPNFWPLPSDTYSNCIWTVLQELCRRSPWPGEWIAVQSIILSAVIQTQLLRSAIQQACVYIHTLQEPRHYNVRHYDRCEYALTLHRRRPFHRSVRHSTLARRTLTTRRRLAMFYDWRGGVKFSMDGVANGQTAGTDSGRCCVLGFRADLLQRGRAS